MSSLQTLIPENYPLGKEQRRYVGKVLCKGPARTLCNDHISLLSFPELWMDAQGKPQAILPELQVKAPWKVNMQRGGRLWQVEKRKGLLGWRTDEV